MDLLEPIHQALTTILQRLQESISEEDKDEHRQVYISVSGAPEMLTGINTSNYR